MTTNILYLLLPLSIAWFGVLLRQVFEMERDGRFKRMWGTIAWSLIPFGVSALVWMSQGEISVLGRGILLGVLGAAIGASIMIWLGYVFTPTAPATSATPNATSNPLPVTPSKPPTPEELQRQMRQGLLERRGAMELAARDAAGVPIRVEFGQSGIEVLRAKDGETEYQVQVSIAGSTGASIWPASTSPKPIYISKTIEHGKPIDLRQLRHSKAQDAFEIGEHAFVVLPDGKILQLILVGVQWYREGDDIDELRFKYKIYPADEFLFDSL